MDISELFEKIASFVWGAPLQIALVGTGIYLTFVLCFIQIRGFGHSWKLLLKGKWDDEAEGEITPFQALTTALSATIGTGNIAGVATAIAAGGPGALLWMWVTALVGMATKYTEAILAVAFRKKDGGVFRGGPMYYLERGLGWKRAAWAFALFGTIAAFGIGNMVQSNSIAVVVHKYTSTPPWITGLVLAIMAGLVIVGGLKRIAAVAERLVPFMCIGYVGGGLIIIFKHFHLLPVVLGEVVREALTPEAGKGFIAGLIVKEAVRFGIARGLFSNESGLGSAPIAHAASQVKHPKEMALIAMMGPFIDTLVVCSVTGLVILMTQPDIINLKSAAITAEAFRLGMGGAGEAVVAMGLTLFAYSTILGWFYYGQQCFTYIFGTRGDFLYRLLFVILVWIGAFVRVELVWNLSDVMNGLMAVPNLAGLIGLSLLARRLSRETSY